MQLPAEQNKKDVKGSFANKSNLVTGVIKGITNDDIKFGEAFISDDVKLVVSVFDRDKVERVELKKGFAERLENNGTIKGRSL